MKVIGQIQSSSKLSNLFLSRYYNETDKSTVNSYQLSLVHRGIIRFPFWVSCEVFSHTSVISFALFEERIQKGARSYLNSNSLVCNEPARIGKIFLSGSILPVFHTHTFIDRWSIEYLEKLNWILDFEFVDDATIQL